MCSGTTSVAPSTREDRFALYKYYVHCRCQANQSIFLMPHQLFCGARKKFEEDYKSGFLVTQIVDKDSAKAVDVYDPDTGEGKKNCVAVCTCIGRTSNSDKHYGNCPYNTRIEFSKVMHDINNAKQDTLPLEVSTGTITPEHINVEQQRAMVCTCGLSQRIIGGKVLDGEQHKYPCIFAQTIIGDLKRDVINETEVSHEDKRQGDRRRDVEKETTAVSVGDTEAKSSAGALFFNDIPPELIRRLAKRYTGGHKKYSPNSLVNYNFRIGLTDPKYIADRLNHLVEHVLNFMESGNDLDDNLAAIVWACAFLMEAERLAPEELRKVVGHCQYFGESAKQFKS